MAVSFGLPDEVDRELLERAVAEWHKELGEAGVRVGMLFASAEDGPAVKHHGHPALASIRVVPLKDRLTKGYDAEMLVDRGWWDGGTEAHRLALLDHELSHLELKREKPKVPGQVGPVLLDDLGRPRLKLRRGDWNPGDGFAAVVARHGEFASEFEDLRRAYAMARAAREEAGADKGAS